MTSSTPADGNGGTAAPIAFTVLRFIGGSNLVGCSTGSVPLTPAATPSRSKSAASYGARNLTDLI